MRNLRLTQCHILVTTNNRFHIPYNTDQNYTHIRCDFAARTTLLIMSRYYRDSHVDTASVHVRLRCGVCSNCCCPLFTLRYPAFLYRGWAATGTGPYHRLSICIIFTSAQLTDYKSITLTRLHCGCPKSRFWYRGCYEDMSGMVSSSNHPSNKLRASVGCFLKNIVK